ncbi:MAG: hypothetical protein CME62_17970 [Halobacteriovoraceae bacterium]|nr:hypothetical protein [Halobacteriovoraceae bacterium]|tara:strand:+ start:18335 stop:18967 length:633 start_codon:yes stop_codon:yes gene_type:complete
MKFLFVLPLFITAQLSHAAVTCEEFVSEESQVSEVQTGQGPLTRENWKTIDVVAKFDVNECFDAISQTLLKVNDKLVWSFRSTEDNCDGGNTYGSVYSYDLKTPIAHIYDGDIYCEKDWDINQRASDMSQSEMLRKAEDFKTYSTERLGQDLGAVRSTNCSKDGIFFQCTFTYDLPVDYCWYGFFSASVTYKLNNHAALEIYEAEVNWDH